MVRSYAITAVLTLIAGILLGLLLGWVLFPKEYTDSHMCQLDPTYQEEYALMIARGYRAMLEQGNDPDREAQFALERLRSLVGVDISACRDDADVIGNIPLWIQELTEQYISQSRQELYCDLALLSKGFGRFTTTMQNACPEIQDA